MDDPLISSGSNVDERSADRDLNDVKNERTRKVLGAILVFLTGGVIFGFNALKPLLFRQEIFANMCGNSDDYNEVQHDGDPQCRKQLLFINGICVVAIFALSFVMYFYETMKKALGQKRFASLAIVCSAGSLILMAIGNRPTKGWLWLVGYALIGATNVCIFMIVNGQQWDKSKLVGPIFKNEVAFEKLYIGIFDSAGAVWLVIMWLYSDQGVNYQQLFGVYAFLVVLVGALVVKFLPCEDSGNNEDATQQERGDKVVEYDKNIQESRAYRGKWFMAIITFKVSAAAPSQVAARAKLTRRSNASPNTCSTRFTL